MLIKMSDKLSHIKMTSDLNITAELKWLESGFIFYSSTCKKKKRKLIEH